VRFDKIATLERSVIMRKLGRAPPTWLAAQQNTFFGVFGFRKSRLIKHIRRNRALRQTDSML
jgi:hypothetical protein